MTIAVLLLVTLTSAQAAVGESVIRGRVLDADGQPMPDVEMRATLVDSERHVAGETAISDAEGKFSIARVPAGRVILRAQPRGSRRLTSAKDRKLHMHPPAYFPGVLDRLDAWPIEIAVKEIIELDFQMPPVFVGSIKASVSGPEGYTLEQLRVMRPESNQIKNVTIDADGIGYAEDLREGRYVVAARGRSRDARLAAFHIAHIAGGELPVYLELAPAGRVTGRVVAERGGIPPIANLRVAAAWTDGTIDLDPLARDDAAVGPDGSFTIEGLFGTRAVRVSGLGEEWRVAAIRHGGRDITSTPVELDSSDTVDLVITLARR